MIPFLILILLAMTSPISAQASGGTLQSTAVAIPGGQGGIGFDDLTYSAELHKVLVPAGHTGKLYLIDPTTFTMTSIVGFSSSTSLDRGIDAGVSSADTGEGFIFTVDHGRHQLVVVDTKSGVAVATAPLLADADYVRYVGFNHEIWVTEPHNKQLEIFKFSASNHLMGRSAVMMFPDAGPESLMIDHLRGRAYTNLGPQAASLDLTLHTVTARWPNGCEKSRGDALDEQRGFLFVSCAEGKAVVFDLNNGHKEISNISTDPGADVISYNSKLSHLYLTSSKIATLSVIGVSAQGGLSLIGKAAADKRSHCVVSDDQNNIWVCDPPRGQLLRYKDTL